MVMVIMLVVVMMVTVPVVVCMITIVVVMVIIILSDGRSGTHGYGHSVAEHDDDGENYGVIADIDKPSKNQKIFVVNPPKYPKCNGSAASEILE